MILVSTEKVNGPDDSLLEELEGVAQAPTLLSLLLAADERTF